MSNQHSRRTFGKRLAAASALPLAALSGCGAEKPAPAKVEGANDQAASTEPAGSEAPAAKTAGLLPADHVLAQIEAAYPYDFTDGQRAALREKIDRIQERSAALSAAPLTNADEPAFIFTAYRKLAE